MAQNEMKSAGSNDPERPAREMKRFLPPKIDHYLQMKWGLALLGEEKGREYLAWLQKKLDRNAQ